VKSGRLRALAVTTAKRSSAAPEVPTLAEAGVGGFDYSTWYALFVPGKTPRGIVDKLHGTTRTVLARIDVKQRLETQGVEAETSTPAELGAYLASETVKWGKVVRATGAKGE
jgi:tripartite-type tricarboxylate transporter receptor subunit TctC